MNIDYCLKSSLEKLTSTILEETGCENVSIAVYDKITGMYAGANDDNVQVGGSEKKIGLLYAVLRLSMKGHLDLSEVINGKDKFKARRLQDPGDDKFTYLELLEGALSNNARSNTNYFSNLLLDAIGMERINQELAEIGFGSTQFNGFYLSIEVSPDANYHHNITTMNDMVLMMSALSDGMYLDNYHSQLANGIFLLNSKLNVLRTEGPNEHQIYKVSQTESDMGIVGRVFGNGLNYFVSISLNEAKSPLYDENFFSTELFKFQNNLLLDALSKVYQYFTNRHDKIRNQNSV